MVADKIVELQDAIGVELTKAYLVPAFTVTRKFLKINPLLFLLEFVER